MNPESHAAALERLAAGVGPGAVFAVERSQVAGSPSLWEDVISLESGGEQRYLRVRSQADEGGAPIGRWAAPAPAARATALAAALREAAIWTLQSEAIAPGEEVITWRWVTEVGVGEVTVPAGSPVLTRLAPLDLEFRRVANELVQAHGGVELTCQVSLVEQAGNEGSSGTMWLVNEGDRDCLVANPLIRTGRGSDFCRLELGHLPEEQPGVTGQGITYAAMPMPGLKSLPPPWDNPYLVLRAGDFLECPVSTPLRTPGSGRHFLRAVYSRYGDEVEIGGMPVVRGRAFSEEHELEVNDGAVGIKGTPVREQRDAPAGSSPAAQASSPDLLRTAVEGAPAVTAPPVEPGPPPAMTAPLVEPGPPPAVEQSSEPPALKKSRSFGLDPDLLKTKLDDSNS